MVLKTQELAKLTYRLDTIRYTQISLSLIVGVLGIFMFILSLILLKSEDLQEWVDFLNMGEIYIGVSILLVASLVVVVGAVMGCVSGVAESKTTLSAHMVLQALAFIIFLLGICVTMQYHSFGGSLQPIVAQSMHELLTNSQFEHQSRILRIVQESIGCCGVNGPHDYYAMSKPLPSECRDTMTGNAFFHGCVDQLTWVLEGRAVWLEVLGLGIMSLNVVLAVLSMVHSKGLDKRDK